MPVMPGGNFVPQSVLNSPMGPSVPNLGQSQAPGGQPSQVAPQPGGAQGGSATVAGIQAAAGQQGQPPAPPQAPGQAPGQQPPQNPASQGWVPNAQGQLLYDPDNGPVTGLVPKMASRNKPLFSSGRRRGTLTPVKRAQAGLSAPLIPTQLINPGVNSTKRGSLKPASNRYFPATPWSQYGEDAWASLPGRQGEFSRSKSAGGFGDMATGVGNIAGGAGTAALGLAQFAQPGGAPRGMQMLGSSVNRMAGGMQSFLGGGAPKLMGGGGTMVGSAATGMKSGSTLETLFTMGKSVKERLGTDDGPKTLKDPPRPMGMAMPQAPMGSSMHKIAAERRACIEVLHQLGCPMQMVGEVVKLAIQVEPALAESWSIFTKRAGGQGMVMGEMSHLMPGAEHALSTGIGGMEHGLGAGAGLGSRLGAGVSGSAESAANAARAVGAPAMGAGAHTLGAAAAAAPAASAAAAAPSRTMQALQAGRKALYDAPMKALSNSPAPVQAGLRTGVGAGVGYGVGNIADDVSQQSGMGRPGYAPAGAMLGAGIGLGSSQMAQDVLPGMLGKGTAGGAAMQGASEVAMKPSVVGGTVAWPIAAHAGQRINNQVANAQERATPFRPSPEAAAAEHPQSPLASLQGGGQPPPGPQGASGMEPSPARQPGAPGAPTGQPAVPGGQPVAPGGQPGAPGAQLGAPGAQPGGGAPGGQRLAGRPMGHAPGQPAPPNGPPTGPAEGTWGAHAGQAAAQNAQQQPPMPTPTGNEHPQELFGQISGWWHGLSSTQKFLIGGALLSLLGGAASGHPGMGLAGGALLGGLGAFGNQIPGMEGIIGGGAGGGEGFLGPLLGGSQEGVAPQGGAPQGGPPQLGAQPGAQPGAKPQLGAQPGAQPGTGAQPGAPAGAAPGGGDMSRFNPLLESLPEQHPWLQQHMGAGDPMKFDAPDAEKILHDYIAAGQGDPQEIQSVLSGLPPDAKQMLAQKVRESVPAYKRPFVGGRDQQILQALQ